MPNFIEENLVMVLLILGAFASYALSIYEKIAAKKKLRVVLVLTTAGLLVTLSLIFLERIKSKAEDALEAKKGEMISDISDHVSNNLKTSLKTLGIARESLTLLKNLESRYGNTAISEIAVELVQPDENMESLHVFEKGDPEKIPLFVEWLKYNPEPAISLTLNAGRHYMINLILAYLLADEENLEIIKNRLGKKPEDWRKFPDVRTLHDLGKISSKVKYVIFYDGDKKHLLGYADAAHLTRELILYHQQRTAQEVEPLLNERGKATRQKLAATFASFRSNVFPAENAYNAAEYLINNKASEGISIYNDKLGFLTLANFIKRAAST